MSKYKHKYEVAATANDGKTYLKQYLTKKVAYADIRRLLSETDGIFVRCDLRKLTDKSATEWYDVTNWQEAKITRN